MTNNLEKKDILIYSIGYETRAGFAAQKTEARHYLALRFPNCDDFSYQLNHKSAVSKGHEILDEPLVNDFLAEKIIDPLTKLKKTYGPDKKITVALDVSSMTRELIFAVISELVKLNSSFNISFSIFYSTGEYKDPPEYSGAYTNFQPIKGLEGWTLFPERPLSVILGLGYETDQAVGVVEYFDPSGAWAYVPHGEDDRFLSDVEKANESLWNFLGGEKKQHYFVNQPNLLYSELLSLAEVLSKKSRVIIVPAGPKIFSAISILIGMELASEVSLWRASYHQSHKRTDTLPAGKIIKFDYDLNRIKAQRAIQ